MSSTSGHGQRIVNGAGQLRRQFIQSCEQRAHLFLPLFQTAQIGEPFRQLPQLLIIQTAGDFLTIARDKGDGVAVVQQLYCGGDLCVRQG